MAKANTDIILRDVTQELTEHMNTVNKRVDDISEAQNTLATELIHEIKATSKRWFILFIVTLCLWFATIAGFILYEYYTIPVDTVTIENDDGNANYIGDDMNGDFNYGESEEN